MSVEFKQHFSLILIFSKDLSKILLRERKGKMDAFLYHNEINKISEPEISKYIKNIIDLEIEPSSLRILTTLPSIDKEWKIDVYMIIADIDKLDLSNTKLISVNEINDTCHPNLKWLVPLSIDATVYGSGFNQIIMK